MVSDQREKNQKEQKKALSKAPSKEAARLDRRKSLRKITALLQPSTTEKNGDLTFTALPGPGGNLEPTPETLLEGLLEQSRRGAGTFSLQPAMRPLSRQQRLRVRRHAPFSSLRRHKGDAAGVLTSSIHAAGTEPHDHGSGGPMASYSLEALRRLLWLSAEAKREAFSTCSTPS